MSDYYIDGKKVDWKKLIRKADQKGCIWNDTSLKTTSEAAEYLRSCNYEVSDKPPVGHSSLIAEKLQIAIASLQEIAEIKYKISGEETEEAEIARKALEFIESIE